MNKKEAADALGVSTKTLERLVAQGKLRAVKVHGRTGLEAQFDDAEVEALRQERNAPVFEAIPADKVRSDTTDRPRQTSLDSRDRQGETALARAGIPDIAQLFGAVLQGQQNNHSRVAITDKLMLTLEEASELSGVSEGKLKEAIRARKLKVVEGVGRGYRIKRPDLDAYVKKL